MVTSIMICLVMLLGSILPTLAVPGQASAATEYAWNSIDGGGLQAGTSSAPTSGEPSIVSWNNHLYAAWSEAKPYNFSSELQGMEIRVMKWDGSQWSAADGGTGLNYYGHSNATNPSLAVYQGCLYAAWIEGYPSLLGDQSIHQIIAKKNCGDEWVSTIEDYIPVIGSGRGKNPVLLVYDNALYVAWQGDSNQTQDQKVQVMKYDGNVWSSEKLDLRFFENGVVDRPRLAIYQNELYLTWSEEVPGIQSSSHIPVYKRTVNGGEVTWENVSGNLGITNTTTSAGSSVLQAYNGLLYAVWRDNNPAQLKVSSFYGNTWGPVGSGNLEKLEEDESQNPNLFVYNDKLFAVWNDQNSSGMGRKNRVEFYDGRNWSAAGEGLPNSVRATSYALHDNLAYLAWSNGSKIQVYSLQENPAPQQVTVSYLPGDHGTISSTSEQVVLGGHPAAVPVVTPSNKYRFIGWSSDGGVTKLSSQEVASLAVTADVTFTAYYTAFLLGDADGDGKVSSSDALLLNKFIKGKITLTQVQLQALDMNSDGQWDEEDIKAILAISVGKG
ncbi:dockerin type I domain-containing protein [Paenibacillus lemnae]|nr:dockerin type I domain-containing protein [Paenibacillus lemnae]